MWPVGLRGSNNKTIGINAEYKSDSAGEHLSDIEIPESGIGVANT